eukprot:RCo039373
MTAGTPSTTTLARTRTTAIFLHGTLALDQGLAVCLHGTVYRAVLGLRVSRQEASMALRDVHEAHEVGHHVLRDQLEGHFALLFGLHVVLVELIKLLVEVRYELGKILDCLSQPAVDQPIILTVSRLAALLQSHCGYGAMQAAQLKQELPHHVGEQQGVQVRQQLPQQRHALQLQLNLLIRIGVKLSQEGPEVCQVEQAVDPLLGVPVQVVELQGPLIALTAAMVELRSIRQGLHQRDLCNRVVDGQSPKGLHRPPTVGLEPQHPHALLLVDLHEGLRKGLPQGHWIPFVLGAQLPDLYKELQQAVIVLRA